MKVPYSKQYVCPQDLVCLLKNRGLSIDDDKEAVDCLTSAGYYRLSAYCYPLLKYPKSDHLYKTNASFDYVMKMYIFDRELRMLLFNEIEKIEVAIRSSMSNIVTEGLNDIFWMTDAANFYSPAIYSKTISLIQGEIEKTKEEFIAHFLSKYDSPFPPAWMIVEVISSWMITLVNLRNLCCHHSRTWNREIPVVPAAPRSTVFPWINSVTTDMKRIYYRICIIKYLLFTVFPKNTLTEKLKSLLLEFPNIDIRAMGFPSNWRSEPLWN